MHVWLWYSFTHLLMTHSVTHLVVAGVASMEYRRVSKLISRLQTLRGQPLWAREQPSLGQPYVASAVDVTAFVQTGKRSGPLPERSLALWAGNTARVCGEGGA